MNLQRRSLSLSSSSRSSRVSGCRSVQAAEDRDDEDERAFYANRSASERERERDALDSPTREQIRKNKDPALLL